MRHSRNDLFPGFYRFLDFLLGMTILVPLIGAALLFWSLTAPSHGRTLYPGQYAQYSDEERAWFKGVHSPKGVPCCDVADGHTTTWRVSPAGYEVPIGTKDDGMPNWHAVPPEAVVENAKNPTRDSIVWYRDYGPTFNDPERYFIRCFVPGDGA